MKISVLQSVFTFQLQSNTSAKMCGIFAYLNFLTPKMRREVLEMLIGGLQRLEYRGYDSAGKWMVDVSMADVII